MEVSGIDSIEIDPTDYLHATRAVELFITDVRDDSKPILTRLHVISRILFYTESCKEMFTEVRAEIMAKREELKRAAASLLAESQSSRHARQAPPTGSPAQG
jgi:hypothetical protein